MKEEGLCQRTKGLGTLEGNLATLGLVEGHGGR